MTRTAAAVACAIWLLMALNRIAWQAGWATPFDSNFMNAWDEVAGVILAASVLGHQLAHKE